jgi:large subunit ribosomal protein L31
MKKDIHPTYYADATIGCACGHTFTVGSTVKDIHVELCSHCHPFYTGQQRLVDTARRVDKFQKRIEAQTAVAPARRGRRTKLAERDAKRQIKVDESSKRPSKHRAAS